MLCAIEVGSHFEALEHLGAMTKKNDLKRELARRLSMQLGRGLDLFEILDRREAAEASGYHPNHWTNAMPICRTIISPIQIDRAQRLAAVFALACGAQKQVGIDESRVAGRVKRTIDRRLHRTHRVLVAVIGGIASQIVCAWPLLLLALITTRRGDQ